jgi:hypothetical protein
VDAVVAKLKALFGDHWTDDLAGEVREILTASVETEVARTTDAVQAELAAAKKAAKTSASEIAKLTKELEAAGKNTDEALAQARNEAAEAMAQVEQLHAAGRARDIRDSALTALAGAELPEERRGVALRSLDLSGVDVDEAGKVVGLTTAVDQLKEREPWLWQASEPAKGGTGKRQGGDPLAKPPGPEQPGDLGRRLAAHRNNQRRARMGLAER